jgi:AraC-like DNA-binding protein
MKTLEEIQHRVGKAFQANKTDSIYYQQKEIGEVKVDIENLGWYSLIKTDFCSKDKKFLFEFKKPLPFICLFFQIKGGTTFIDQQIFKMPEKHHSLNYLPSLESQYTVDKHMHLQDFSIKINPEALADKLLRTDMLEDSWQRMVEDKQPYITFDASKKMNPIIWDTLLQLLHCPYSGALGHTYKDLLVQMLFIHQVMCFNENNKTLPLLDNKLHKRDVEVLHAIKHYLDQHYLDDLSLEAIVKEFGINTFKLKYGFKKLFGTPVMKFIDDKKMAYAKQLLLDSHTEVIEVAEKLGYNHYNNFSAAFKRKFGHSPAFFANKEAYIAHM